MSIVIPILFAGTRNMGKVNSITLLIEVSKAIFQPIILHYQLAIAKFVKMKLLKQEDLAFASDYHEIFSRIKLKQNELRKLMRIQLGTETIFQLTGNVILLCYGISQTRTTQGLAALFMQDSFVFLNIRLSSKFVFGFLLTMNLASFIRVNFNGIIEDYSSNNKMVGKLMLVLSIFCGSMVRIWSMTLYFSPPLGLFHLLHHYQGKFLTETSK